MPSRYFNFWFMTIDKKSKMDWFLFVLWIVAFLTMIFLTVWGASQ